MTYIDSYYNDTRIEIAPFSALAEHIEADVCIVGAGLAGLTAARELAVAGRSVCVLEAEEVGWGASGRNGGFVSDGFAEGMPALEKKLGKDHAKQLFRVSQEGTQYVKDRMAGFATPQVPMGQNWMAVVRHDVGDAMLRHAAQMNAEYGAQYEARSTAEVRTLLRSDTYYQGLEDGSAIHIHPLNYVLGLADDARAQGAQIFTHSPAVDLQKMQAGFELTTKQGMRVHCAQVILCGSAYLHNLYPRIEGAVLPVATYVVTSKPMENLLAEAILYRGAISDTRRAGDYYRLVDEGKRLLWGGRITTQKSEPKKLANMLKNDITRIYPQLDTLEIDYAWSGLMGYCVHKMPLLRELEPGIWTATATGGHGLNTTATIGKLVAEAVAGHSDRYKLFAPFKARWGGGMLGRAATQIAYWGMQLQDWREERA
ncbi:NAD(P)/FAD-dependent oxidoreductase [Maritalea mediterranea]|uniref:FAD-binding oxidoreductase n=1 Tax=Maritalea mediterranea TaxID=2909667 RepID=A0ABS9E632_9HYPH|nr:FAD-binding oxidoreductase [Maritalea mediterranea]MCF4097672.1 FAD-binding oxidoreductase [Maritalea mediterranea]